VYVKVSNVGVGGVGVCMMCGSVSEYPKGLRVLEEGSDFQDLARLSYTRRYISLVVESTRNWGML
jgi:hypothetical protein